MMYARKWRLIVYMDMWDSVVLLNGVLSNKVSFIKTFSKIQYQEQRTFQSSEILNGNISPFMDVNCCFIPCCQK